MVTAKFKDFESDVILIVGGCEKNIVPTLMNIKEVFPEAPSIQCIIIQTTVDNWEYTGFHMLHIYRDHPLVFDDRYLTIHDTCTVVPDFVHRYELCKTWKPSLKGRNKNPEAWIYSVTGIKHRRLSNIYLFSREVVLNYKDNFKTKLTKGEAVDVEGRRVRKGVRPLLHFGVPFNSGVPRQVLPARDVYDTGYNRLPHYYPVFGIVKWILLHFYGDFTEPNIKLNFPKK